MSKIRKNNPAFRIVLTYLLIGCVWIAFSDELVSSITTPNRLTEVFIVKGWFFVGITATLLYFFINRCLKQLESSGLKFAVSEERLQLALSASHMGVWE